MSNGPTVTLAEAARRSHLSQATIRRWLKADKLEGAERTAEGWAIPVASLVEAGAWPSTTPADDDDLADADAGTDDDQLRAHLEVVAKLEAELATERARRESADALREAAERNADDLRRAMRMLEAAPMSAPTPRRRWWNRSAPTTEPTTPEPTDED